MIPLINCFFYKMSHCETTMTSSAGLFRPDNRLFTVTNDTETSKIFTFKKLAAAKGYYYFHLIDWNVNKIIKTVADYFSVSELLVAAVDRWATISLGLVEAMNFLNLFLFITMIWK